MKRGITVLNALILVVVLVGGLLIMDFIGSIFSEDISGKIVGNETINVIGSQTNVTQPSGDITQSPQIITQPSENVTGPVASITKPSQIVGNVTLPRTNVTSIPNETIVSTTTGVTQPSEKTMLSEDIIQLEGEDIITIEAINITPPTEDITQIAKRAERELSLLAKGFNLITKLFKQTKTIDDCMVITSSGSYVLNKDLITGNLGRSGLCIIFDGQSDVHINCNGHTIYGGSLVRSDLGIPNLLNSPLIYIRGSKDFSITNCILNNNPDPFKSHTELILIQDSFSGVIKDNTFDSGINNIISYNSDDIKIINNNISNMIGLYYGDNLFISKNNFTIQDDGFHITHKAGNLILHSSSNTVIIDNFIDGKMNPCCNLINKGCCSDLEAKGLYKGSDDGIILDDVSNSIIMNNKIINSWDCGIETSGVISNSIISNNILIDNAFCGIGGWYNNGQINNTFENNRISNSRFGFNFAYVVLSSLPNYKGVIYFANNTFENNIGYNVDELNFNMVDLRLLDPDESATIERNKYDSNKFTFMSPIGEKPSEFFSCSPYDLIVGSNNVCQQVSEYKCSKVECVSS